MRAGTLRHRITIQEKPTPTPRNAHGEEVFTWSDVATVWAAKVDISGREFMEARREGVQISTRFVIRYRSGLKETMRVTHDSRTYEIRAVLDPEGRRRELHLLCEEIG
jgi:SPP1 family predicted phage head-tail adaptor